MKEQLKCQKTEKKENKKERNQLTKGKEVADMEAPEESRRNRALSKQQNLQQVRRKKAWKNPTFFEREENDEINGQLWH